jgi:hypothetical protein
VTVNYTSAPTFCSLNGETDVSFRHASLALLVLSFALVGCKKKAPPQAPPPPPPEEPKPKVEPKVEPKPEPKSDGPGKLSLPEKSAAGPWVVGRAPDPESANAVVIAGVPPLAVSGLAVRPTLHRAVLTSRHVEKKGAPVATRIVLCDTAAGRVLSEWPVAGEHAVLDLSPDGRSILTSSPAPGKRRETLHLWQFLSNGKLRPWSWEPHEVPAAGPPTTDSGRQLSPGEAVEVRWAAFVGTDRVVSMSWGGQLRVWNPDGPELLASIDTTPCRPAVTPDGTRVAFVAGESVALLDPTAARVIDTRPIGPPPPYPALAFNPEGTRLAVGGNGKALVLDLADGTVRHAPLPKLRVTDNGVYDRSFAWIGRDYLLADQQLHDLNFPLPVWEYRGAEQTQVRGWQLWLNTRKPGTYGTTVRAFDLPHADVQARIAAAKGSPGTFSLKPGDRVRVDVSGVPADRQTAAKSALEDRLRELGHVPDDGGPVALVASVDLAGIKTTVAYAADRPSEYVRRPAKLQLVFNGKELWSEEWSAPPPLFPKPEPKEKMEKYLERVGAGEPNYDLFKKAPLPTYVAAPTAPVTALGASEFTPDGIKDGPSRP